LALLIVPVLLGAGILVARAYAAGPDAGSPQHKAFMEKRLDKMLDKINATDAQRSSIKTIFESAFTELKPIHQQQKALHSQLLTAFAATTVDPTAVENLRKQIPGLVDQASQIFAKALEDASQVLTVDQRQTLVKTIEQHHGGHHPFM
jgi:Spy/CpxP family protein refolding chaperone